MPSAESSTASNNVSKSDRSKTNRVNNNVGTSSNPGSARGHRSVNRHGQRRSPTPDIVVLSQEAVDAIASIDAILNADGPDWDPDHRNWYVAMRKEIMRTGVVPEVFRN
jgi:hypothetical protein